MARTTPILGLPVPAGSDTNNVPRDVGALADKIDGGTPPPRMSQAVRDALPAGQRPAGYLIWNTTAQRYEQSTGAAWLPLVSATSFHVSQALAANAAATIAHNLGQKWVGVHAYDSTGTEVGIEVQLVDANTCKVTSSAAGTFDIVVKG